MKKFVKEFKEFAIRGNVMDLAIAVIIGAAFGKIVTSLVNDVIMPFIVLITGKADLSSLNIVLGTTLDKDGKTIDLVMKTGLFLQTVIDFVIIAFIIFLLVKALAKLKRKEEEKPVVLPEPTKEELLLTEIRDLLKEKQ